MEPDSWLGVELRHLAALEAVAREGTFGRAAVSLGYTQSAISQQIQTLERLVGERLLERPGGPRAVSLTEAGALLLRHAESIIARLHAAQADMAALSQGQSGALRIGTFQSVGAKVLPGRDASLPRRLASRRARADASRRPTTTCSGSSSAASSSSRSRCCRRSKGRSSPQEILRDPYVLLVPADHELGGLERASIADLGDLTLIGNRACRSTALAEGELVQRGVTVDVAFRSDDNGTVQGLVGAGFGAALVPLLTVDRNDARVSVLEIEPEIPHRRDRARVAPGPAPLPRRARLRRPRRARSAPRSRPRSPRCQRRRSRRGRAAKRPL